MRRTVSLVSSMLAVGLLFVGCADGDTSTERQESQAGDLAASGDDGPLNGTVREGAERRATLIVRSAAAARTAQRYGAWGRRATGPTRRKL